MTPLHTHQNGQHGKVLMRTRLEPPDTACWSVKTVSAKTMENWQSLLELNVYIHCGSVITLPGVYMTEMHARNSYCNVPSKGQWALNRAVTVLGWDPAWYSVLGGEGSFYYPTYFFLFWVFSINPCVSLFICPHFEFLRNTRVPMETVRPWFWISEIKERKNRRNSI